MLVLSCKWVGKRGHHACGWNKEINPSRDSCVWVALCVALSGSSKSCGEKICKNTPFCQPFGFQIGLVQGMAVGCAEHGARGEGIYLSRLGSPAGQHVATITVNYLLSPESVRTSALLSRHFGCIQLVSWFCSNLSMED